ncbi:exodeoxyribonuclease VII large subunit [Methyloversatilis sp.]|uniref:exodeoxyribonuclease VII large subunit n=1 Tax=Methyloversatilis sp. TaxID=2569862 RepID=UPI0035ADF8B5
MNTFDAESATSAAIPVSELARRARIALERQFPVLWVAGELSGVTRAASGHLYFSLKDDIAQVRCVMFRGRSQLLAFEPRVGLRVEARGQVSLYEARGDFQLTVDAMRQAGVGSLYESFLRLKAKLDAEGLFDGARKRPLPALPATLAIVTSPAAAALQDVLSTLKRRAPHLRVVLVPTLVQGGEAPSRISAAIAIAGTTGADVVLIVRGGGSAEDLAAFNDEGVARAIASCPVPVVCGVGHETDFSIADFVADLRAATPTAAAELVSAGHVEAAARLKNLSGRLVRALRGRLDARAQKLDDLASRLHPPAHRLSMAGERTRELAARMGRALSASLARNRRSAEILALRLQAVRPPLQLRGGELHALDERLRRAVRERIGAHERRLGLLALGLEQLNPRAVLMRGYAIVRDEEGRIVGNASSLMHRQSLRIDFAHGHADVEVSRSYPDSGVAD